MIKVTKIDELLMKVLWFYLRILVGFVVILPPVFILFFLLTLVME